MATGLLLLLVGKSTKLAPFLSSADKTYLATIRLGLLTDTLDLTGQTLSEYDGPYPSSEEVQEALDKLTGPVWQMPPIFSAIKVKGKTAHKAARAGKKIDLPARQVMAQALKLIDYQPPLVSISAHVGKGYYIRSLARDLGQALGLGGGSLSQLRRLSVGSFSLAEAGPIPETFLELQNRLVSPRLAVNHLPELESSWEELVAIGRGQSLPWPQNPPGLYKLISPDGLLAAIGEIVEKAPTIEKNLFSPEGPFLRPLRVFMPAQGAKITL
jgi:tRNA pseudouridine55 synthase